MLKLHDTMTGGLREVTASPDGVLRFYACGPTIHDHAHVGNFRTFVWVDVTRRVLEARGFDLLHVMNITDVEDKIIERATAAGLAVEDPANLPLYTEQYEKAFREDLAALRIRPAHAYPKATDYVPQMVELVETLISRGHAYESAGSVYFDVKSMPSYGRLSNLDPDAIRTGSQEDKDEYEKDDVRDFVLWKASREGEPRWDSPWGPGRPGWHLECSVMSKITLGASTLDLHAGGEDLVFPHHENEIAQSEGSSGETFCKHWIHSAHLQVEGKKMSKSLGNFYTLRDLVAKGHEAVAIRYLLASVHYRAPLNLTEEGIKGAAKAVSRLLELDRRLTAASPDKGASEDPTAILKKASEDFDSALDDNLNTSEALGVLFGALREVNAALDAGASVATLKAARVLLAQADDIFAFLPTDDAAEQELVREIAGATFTVRGAADIPLDILERVADRQEARKTKDFETSDRLRDELAAAGYDVEDAPQGARVKPKS